MPLRTYLYFPPTDDEFPYIHLTMTGTIFFCIGIPFEYGYKLEVTETI